MMTRIILRSFNKTDVYIRNVSHLTFIFQDKEVSKGGSAPRILSIDDYFLVEKDYESGEENKKDGVDVSINNLLINHLFFRETVLF